jgi:hypothetical protein
MLALGLPLVEAAGPDLSAMIASVFLISDSRQKFYLPRKELGWNWNQEKKLW